jgi:hypothetical protein
MQFTNSLVIATVNQCITKQAIIILAEAVCFLAVVRSINGAAINSAVILKLPPIYLLPLASANG